MMNRNVFVACAALVLLAASYTEAAAQQSCWKFGVGSGYVDRTTQANYAVERCDSTVEKVRMVTVWRGVSRPVPQNAGDSAWTAAHSRALRELNSGVLTGYVHGGMSSTAGAWYLAVHQSGETAIAYSDSEARPHVLERYKLPGGDSILVVFLEHRDWPAKPVVLSSETIDISITIPRTDPRSRQASIREMLDIVLRHSSRR